MGAFHLGKRPEWVVLSLGEPEHVVPFAARLAFVVQLLRPAVPSQRGYPQF
jgi:hypothetical protein